MRQRAEQILQLRRQAEEAASDKRYDEAIADLQEACGLDPANSELSELLDTARQKKRRRELVEGYLRQADRRAVIEAIWEQLRPSSPRHLKWIDEDSRVRAAHVLWRV